MLLERYDWEGAAQLATDKTHDYDGSQLVARAELLYRLLAQDWYYSR
jgi:hypothetical protein